MGDLVLSAPKKRPESPSEECLGSHARPQKVGLRAPGTSRPMTGEAARLVGTYQAMR
jgi:hypothetical protein